jgi:hypothetical protein
MTEQIYNDNFHKVNKYGIVNVEGLEKRIQIRYYTLLFSITLRDYKAANEGDAFENDRHFIHKIAPVSLDQWASQQVPFW